MLLTVTENLKFLKVVEADEIEIKQLAISLKKFIRNYWFRIKSNPRLKKSGWTGEVSFFNQRTGLIPIGLWHEVIKICETYKYPIQIDDLDKIMNNDFDEAEFIKWVDTFFKNAPRQPRDYQITSAINIIKYGWSSSEIATSAGKTLIVYMVFAYLKTHNKLKRMLVVVPNVSLVIQGQDDFETYSKDGKLLKYKLQQIGGNAPKAKKEVDIVFGTFQSLREMDDEFFEDFDVLCVDEAHTVKTDSVKAVLSKCVNANIRFGLSGTLGASLDDADSFTIISLIGPVVNKISASFLSGKNKKGITYATPVYIRMIYMDYLSLDAREALLRLKNRKVEYDGTKMFALERKVIIENKERLDFVVDVISNVTENSLVLFHNIKDGYGRQMFDKLNEMLPKKYQIFYVDGNTTQKLRNFYIESMDKKTKTIKILIASYGTFSTGISINNLHYVFLCESFKSEKIILQSIGRGMRLMEGKQVINIIDFVDDFEYKGYTNYTMQHAKDRENMYIEQGYKYKKIYKKFGVRSV